MNKLNPSIKINPVFVAIIAVCMLAVVFPAQADSDTVTILDSECAKTFSCTVTTK